MTIAVSVVQLGVAIALAFLCGYGVVRLLLPDEYREFRYVIMPPVGYAVYCWIAFSISGSLQLSVAAATWIVIIGLSVLAAVVAWRYRHYDSLGETIRGLKTVGLLSVTLAIVVLWPLFYVGPDTYLGAVNPDYFASFKDNVFLTGHSVVDRSLTLNTYSPFESDAGSLPPSARFSAALFAILLQAVLQIMPRTALTLSIGAFLFCLPLSVYFMARVAFRLPRAAATLCAVLIGLSSSVTVSFLYFYVGQNSGLAATPLLLTVLTILITRPSWRIMVLAACLISSLFVMYFGMLPYAVAPPALLGLYLLVRRQLSPIKAVGIAFGLLGCLVVVNLAMLPYLLASLRGWQSLVGLSLQGQYFIDYLTELFVPTFLGYAMYPVDATPIVRWLGQPVRIALLLISALTSVALLVAAIDWGRRSRDKVPVVLAAACVLIYGLAWWYYVFERQYGYAAFKMATWLQFLLVLPVAYGLYRLWIAVRSQQSRRFQVVPGVALAVGTVAFAGSNLVVSLEYGRKGLGTDPTSIIINTFQVSGNRDYLDLPNAARQFVAPDESIGLALTDTVQNNWVGYYLRDHKLSYLSHYMFPGDDEVLPDIATRRTVDFYGNVAYDSNPFFHGATDAYYLLESPSRLNNEIVDQTLPQPIWQDTTFQLIRASETRDLMVTGRGFYRIEQLNPHTEFWWPPRFRWTNAGGEIYLLHPAYPGEPYRLTFSAIVGYGPQRGTRRIELWQNTTKFDELTIDGSARVVSKPFYPTGDVDRLVIKVLDESELVPRPLALWNRGIPADYRGLNLAMSGIHVIAPDAAPTPVVANESIVGQALLTEAQSFNGLDTDGWVRQEASLSFVRPSDADWAEVVALVPGNLNITFPYAITLDVDGVQRSFSADGPGELSMRMPLQHNQIVDIKIRPVEAPRVISGDAVLHQVLQTVHLEGVTFYSGAAFRARSLSLASVNPSGIDSDGWMSEHARLTLPAEDQIESIDIEVELPGWANINSCTMTVVLDQGQTITKNLTPGLTTLRIPISPDGPTNTVDLYASAQVQLPAPDVRTRSIRIRSLQVNRRPQAAPEPRAVGG